MCMIITGERPTFVQCVECIIADLYNYNTIRDLPGTAHQEKSVFRFVLDILPETGYRKNAQNNEDDKRNDEKLQFLHLKFLRYFHFPGEFGIIIVFDFFILIEFYSHICRNKCSRCDTITCSQIQHLSGL